MYACIGASYIREYPRGPRGTRCRKASGACPEHNGVSEEEVLPLLRPDVVLLRINVNPGWVRKLREVGIPLVRRVEQWEKEIRARHIAEAEAIGWSAFPYRKDAPASGTAVFGKDGTQQVGVVDLLEEMAESGFVPLDIHLEERSKTSPVFIIGFTRDGEPSSVLELATERLLELLSASWEFVHVYANPPKEDGLILHTVNACRRRPEEAPRHTLSFAGGLWRVV